MKISSILIFAVVISQLAATASAQTFTFGIETNPASSDLDTLASGSTISGGLTLTAAASSGVFGAGTTTGFGINAAPSGDSTTQFDDGSTDGAEFMTFSFDKDITFQSISLSLFGASDEAFLTIGGTTITIDDGEFTFAPGLTLAANTDATFGFQAGNGFQLESLTVVPEPNTYALLAGISALGVVMLRRRMVK